ncbi:membrane protein implicated in regulation of membrane protease activity [Deinococcus sp. HSC-46F16]|uniref:NfeD family protein n=1 Tax=Deinococcus sp. HSC-46F16 TaxID=2910968 RepID=UPI00209E1445|nr:NfeD family protein [Deinococcus sp. HSC-46F16]MCP2014957.1 membrane protein implicated in regulation of membrane protease activity [Deinococcus sp. HSC-46F16]
MDFYLLCLIVGGGLLVLSLVGGHDHAAPDDHPEAGDLASWFSLRSVVSFAAFFGLAGTVAGLLGLGGVGRLVMALVTGLAVGAFTAFAFRLARTRGEVSGGAGRLTGRTGKVLVPPAPGRPGKVAVTVAGQIEHALARSTDALKTGDAVIVLGVQGGILDVGAWDGRDL